MEDAEDYKGFEAAIIADYDAQSAVERELVLRLASLLWRLRRATTIETSLFEIQADHLSNFRKTHQISPASRDIVCAPFNTKAAWHGVANATETRSASGVTSAQGQVAPDVELARCFLRLCNLPNYVLDRPFGAKLARPSMRSMRWIAANHRSECAVSGSEEL